jgi:hypothetical protein
MYRIEIRDEEFQNLKTIHAVWDKFVKLIVEQRYTVSPFQPTNTPTDYIPYVTKIEQKLIQNVPALTNNQQTFSDYMKGKISKTGSKTPKTSWSDIEKNIFHDFIDKIKDPNLKMQVSDM